MNMSKEKLKLKIIKIKNDINNKHNNEKKIIILIIMKMMKIIAI